MSLQRGEISKLEVIPLARAHEYVGLETFVTDWISVPKDRMDMFEQSIGATPGETDLSISQANPLGPNLINGVWLIARAITIGFDYMPIREPGMWGFNYGYEKVRFLTPVMVDPNPLSQRPQGSSGASNWANPRVMPDGRVGGFK